MKVRHLDIEFEIPDQWLCEDDLLNWIGQARTASAYNVLQPPYPPDPQDGGIPQVQARIVALNTIEPVLRTLSTTGTPFESKERLLRVFAGMRSGQPLPPIHTREAAGGLYSLTLYHGMHRFLASIAAGFTHIPVVVSPRFTF